jgi:DNA-binding transcriptional ArsR family regulator
MLRHFKAEFFRVLANPTRIRILDLLRDGELTVGDIQYQLEVEQSTVSQHLSALRAINFVETRREGTSMWYSVSDPAIWQLLDVARDIYERQLHKNRMMLKQLG